MLRSRHVLYAGRWAPFKKDVQVNLYNYKYTLGIRQIFNILLGLGMIGFAVLLFFNFGPNSGTIVLVTVLTLLGTVPILISLHYFIRSKNLNIRIQTDNNLIEIELKDKKIVYRLEDLKSIEIHEHKGLGLYEFDFDYAKYTFRNDKYFIATSFMTNKYFIPAGIEPKIKREFLPIIWKEFDI